MNVNILGTNYIITEKTQEEDKYLARADCDGYCDKSDKRIVLLKLTEDNCSLGDIEAYKKKVLRHEIVHAFLFESGLAESMHIHHSGDHDEQIVDWFAYQGPKIYAAWREVDAVDA